MSESRLVIAADFSFCKRKREHACALEVSKRGHVCDGARGDSTGRADRAMGRIEQNRAIAFHAPTPPLLAQVPLCCSTLRNKAPFFPDGTGPRRARKVGARTTPSAIVAGAGDPQGPH